MKQRKKITTLAGLTGKPVPSNLETMSSREADALMREYWDAYMASEGHNVEGRARVLGGAASAGA